MAQNAMLSFGHLGGLGQKHAKMDPKMIGFGHLGGLSQKCAKLVLKTIGFSHSDGLGPFVMASSQLPEFVFRPFVMATHS